MYALKTIISPNKEFERFQFTPTLPGIFKQKTKKGQLLTMHIKNRQDNSSVKICSSFRLHHNLKVKCF